MGPAERRNEILKVLCQRRYDKIHNLAFEFGVSERTIRRDIEIMSLSEPIFTQPGRFGGGVYVMEGYTLNRMYVSDDEAAVLHKLSQYAEKKQICILTEDELKIVQRMLKNYTIPKYMKDKS